jgi:hypothetical protein
MSELQELLNLVMTVTNILMAWLTGYLAIQEYRRPPKEEE